MPAATQPAATLERFRQRQLEKFAPKCRAAVKAGKLRELDALLRKLELRLARPVHFNHVTGRLWCD